MARLCGAGSFSREEEEDVFSPRAEKSTRRRRGGANPYAGRGLEKYTMVLAELETRREKIMAKVGEQGVSAVRFMQSNSQDWIPIVVRRRPPPPPPESGSAAVSGEISVPVASSIRGGDGKVAAISSWKGYYWGAVVVMILACLAASGRVTAICCTAAWWYLAPPKGKAAERKKLDKEYARRMSERYLGGGGVAPAGSREVLPSPRTGAKIAM